MCKAMGYYIDLKKIAIDDFKEILRTTELIPSWKILEEEMDYRFSLLKNEGIGDLEKLLSVFKSKDRIKQFSTDANIPEKYLVVLKRVVSGYKQKPNRLQDFSCISKEVVERLEKVGVKNTLKLYERILTQEKRRELSSETGIDDNDTLLLTKLADISRIRWVNHTFAYVLLESGYDTVKKIAEADFKSLYLEVKKLNEERKIYNASLGEKDMKMVIESASMLEQDILY